jgi:hypothetical protein
MPLGATPSRWCVCQFHHFRPSKPLYFNYLLCTPPSASVRCIRFCHYLLHRTVGEKLSASLCRQTGKQGMDCVRLRVDVTHGRFDVIVPRCVLQCERVRMLPGLGQKCVPQTVKPGVGVGSNPGPKRSHLRFQYPGSKRLAWISGVGEDIVTL